MCYLSLLLPSISIQPSFFLSSNQFYVPSFYNKHLLSFTQCQELYKMLTIVLYRCDQCADKRRLISGLSLKGRCMSCSWMSAVKWSAGHNRAVTHVNSQSLWLHTRDLHKVYPAERSLGRGGAQGVPPHWGALGNGELLEVGESQLPSGYSP